jgi:hypothetical protein
MISDSPYPSEELALPLWAGAVAGAAGAALMLLPLAWLTPDVPAAAGSFAERLMWVVGRGPMRFHRALFGPDGGLLFHGVAGTVLGLLYASSQRRSPPRGIVAVGIFFGFLLWVVSGPILGVLVGERIAGDFRSLAWAIACLTFGVFLSIVTLAVQRRRRAGTVAAVPRD